MRFAEGEVCIYAVATSPDLMNLVGSEVTIFKVGPFHHGQVVTMYKAGFAPEVRRIDGNFDYIIEVPSEPGKTQITGARDFQLRKKEPPQEPDRVMVHMEEEISA